MILEPKQTGALALRLIAVLSLLGWPGSSSAQGTWSVISLPQKPGEVIYPSCVAVDAAGELFVADNGGGAHRIQKRDAQGNWSTIAAAGSAIGQVDFGYYEGYYGAGLGVDGAGNLYVADFVWDG